MVKIEDDDLPIAAAQKIIMGTKPYNPTPLKKEVYEAVYGKGSVCNSVDMFDLDEIKEIADYLMAYYNNHVSKEDNV